MEQKKKYLCWIHFFQMVLLVVFFIFLGSHIHIFTTTQTHASNYTKKLSIKVEDPTVRTMLIEENLEKYQRNIENASSELKNSEKAVLGSRLKTFGSDRNHLEVVLNRGEDAKTVMLTVNTQLVTSMLIKEYFAYSSNDCKFVAEHANGGKSRNKLFNCTEDLKKMISGHSFQHLSLNIGLPGGYMQSRGNEDRTLTFMHIFRDAVVDHFGDVWTSYLNVIPQRCKINKVLSLGQAEKMKIPHYKKVLSIAQFWGNGFYHSTIENLPRIVPYLNFLKLNPDIHIHHHPTSMKFLKLLDIPNLKHRSVTSKFVRGTFVYSPAGNPCGSSPIFTTQLLSLYLQRKAASVLSTSSKRNIIVLIKRSAKRFFANHDDILRMLQLEAASYDLEVKVFKDNPVPSIEETMDMFHRAVMVVAPHGAGEANLLFAQPGTVVIEGLCWDSLHRGNLCYRNLSYVLGLRHHVIFTKKQCMSVTDKQIQEPVKQFLQMLI